MSTYAIAFYLAVVLPALAAAPGSEKNSSSAEQSGTAWAKVERLRPGQTVRVLCSGDRTWTGRLAGVSAEGLALDFGGIERKAVRSEVLRVQVKSRAISAVAGSVIGAAAGAGFGYAVGSGLKGGERAAAAGLGAGLFAAAGAGVGSLLPGWKTVYVGEPPESSSPQRAPRR